jgi:hypothetical protein
MRKFFSHSFEEGNSIGLVFASLDHRVDLSVESFESVQIEYLHVGSGLFRGHTVRTSLDPLLHAIDKTEEGALSSLPNEDVVGNVELSLHIDQEEGISVGGLVFAVHQSEVLGFAVLLFEDCVLQIPVLSTLGELSKLPPNFKGLLFVFRYFSLIHDHFFEIVEHSCGELIVNLELGIGIDYVQAAIGNLPDNFNLLSCLQGVDQKFDTLGN